MLSICSLATASARTLWNLFSELVDLNRQRRARRPETSSGTTLLVDATVILFNEFTLKKDASLTRHVARERRREDEELDSVVDSFERHTCMTH